MKTSFLRQRFSRSKLRKLLLIVLLAIILAISFMAYLQPAFVLDLANRFILC